MTYFSRLSRSRKVRECFYKTPCLLIRRKLEKSTLTAIQMEMSICKTSNNFSTNLDKIWLRSNEKSLKIVFYHLTPILIITLIWIIRLCMAGITRWLKIHRQPSTSMSLSNNSHWLRKFKINRAHLKKKGATHLLNLGCQLQSKAM